MRNLPIHDRGAAENPPNRFERLSVSREAWTGEEDPDPETKLYRDDTRSILSTNDSPDVPFEVSLNPYRGCEHGCVYCLRGDTPVLMADGATRLIRDIRPGNEIYGTERRGPYRQYVRTRVLDAWRTLSPAVRLTVADGTTLVAGEDHRLLTRRGWKFMTDAEQGAGRRPHLTVNDQLLGTGAFAPSPEHTESYSRGYLSGVIRGDGHRASYQYERAGRAHGNQHQFRLERDLAGQALKSSADLNVESIEELGVELPMYDLTTGTGDFIAAGIVSHNCYARPTHEYLGLSAGLDFETRIFVKEDAPALLREELEDPSWEPRPVAMSGVTDPYQPAERRLEITRGCLQVLAEFRNPVGIVTKNRLVTRDRDLLAELAEHDAARVSVSVTTLDADLKMKMEPRAPAPGRRLDAIEQLAEAGVPVDALVAPVIPGLTDHEIPEILAAVADAGAGHASYVLLRLPHGVSDLFENWLEHHFPDRKQKVLNRIRDTRGGRLNDPQFGSRMSGEGPFARQISEMFEISARRHGLDGSPGGLSTDAFRRPTTGGGQVEMFADRA